MSKFEVQVTDLDYINNFSILLSVLYLL